MFRPKTKKKLSCSEITAVFKSWKLWVFCMVTLGHNVIGAVVTFYLPAIIGSFKSDDGIPVSGIMANLLSAPPYLLSIAVLILVSWNSDRTRERPKHLFIPFSFQILAWGAVSLCFFFEAGLAALYTSVLIAVGIHYSFPPIFWAWLTQEFTKDTGVAVSTGWVATFGSLSQIWVPLMTSAIFESTNSYVYVGGGHGSRNPLRSV